ncbi:type-F conjugative transfer system pilin assembly protein TrbC [Desulfurivibrio sp. D14AmB]|uniref:type-F conjugative transfer system pilin assembly protein TrbC n=1 Tax=Desulfurivibrio sp. D14AmB TaxID=3374370 RepID=UPI00376F1EAD
MNFSGCCFGSGPAARHREKRMRKLITILPLTCLLWANITSGQESNMGMSDIANQLRQAEELAKSLEMPDQQSSHAEKARQAAEELFRQFNAPEHQARIKREEQRLRETIFADVLNEYGQNHGAEATNDFVPGLLADHERVYLLISSSVPESTLKNYMTMIERAQEPNLIMVMRGFIGGMEKIRPTIQYLQNLRKKDPSCNPTRAKCDLFQVNIQINPLLFRQYGITRAPAVVYAANVPSVEIEQPSGSAFIIEGDAALDYLLERINREAKSETLAGLIRALQGTN